MYLGSYTFSQGGHGSGIEVLALDHEGLIDRRLAVAPALDPSYLAVVGNTIVAVEEGSPGAVSSWVWDGKALAFRSRVSSGGDLPCHVLAIDRLIFVVNYGTPVCSTFRLTQSATLIPLDSLLMEGGGSGTSPRQSSSHLHSAIQMDEASRIAIADLGSDRVVEVSIDHQGHIRFGREVRLGLGSGPRHIARLGSLLLVLCELDLSIVQLSLPALQRHGITFPPKSPQSLASHVAVDPKFKMVYSAVRGQNVIRLHRFAETRGELTAMQEIRSGGSWPRHFALSRDRMYVANQASSSIAVFDIDPSTGVVKTQLQEYSVGSPACIVLGA